MNDTRMMDYNIIIPKRAAGYKWENNQYFNKAMPQDPVVEFADGGLISTVTDMAKWDAALYSHKLLKKETLKQMFEPAKTKQGLAPYGIGFGLTPYQGHRRVGHLGSIPGFVSAFSRFIDDKISVILFINIQLKSGQVDIANQLAAFYFEK
jgi:CubicO group peptidase (beta-lactamase class C family)